MQHQTLLQSASSYLIAVFVFIFLIGFYLVGYWFRLRMVRKNKAKSDDDIGTINGTLLGLLALMLAFSFGMANSRYDTRRQLVIEEANAIGTVILRTDIYPDSMRNLLHTLLKDYVKARIGFYKAGSNVDLLLSEQRRSGVISGEIWKAVADYAKKDDVTTRTSVLIPALNDMIDITTTRLAAGEANIPDSILYFLFTLCFCSAFLLGYDQKNRFDWTVLTGFAIMLSVTVFTIIDLDRPRSGLINMDKPNQKIENLMEMFD
jgi:hypothetical protein